LLLHGSRQCTLSKSLWRVTPMFACLRCFCAAQLTNWLKYLDYVEAKGNDTATVVLFERCLVPCASYPGECASVCRMAQGASRSGGKS
jgi:hypothetical protein